MNKKNYIFSWKKGLLWSAMFVLVGFVLFMTIGGPLDTKCKNTDQIDATCQGYLAWDGVVQAYTDTWRSIFAPECIGGEASDSCLGPDFAIMFWSLAISGFAIGCYSKRKSSDLPPTT